jgi:peptidoglycan/LPS O-acetylase OafA/YrhL
VTDLLTTELAAQVGVYAVAVTVLVEVIRRWWAAVDGPWVLLAALVAGQAIAILSARPGTPGEWMAAALCGLAAAVVAVCGTGTLQRIASKGGTTREVHVVDREP